LQLHHIVKYSQFIQYKRGKVPCNRLISKLVSQGIDEAVVEWTRECRGSIGLEWIQNALILCQ